MLDIIVITPFYNAERSLRDTIQSVRNQNSLLDFKHILVNDLSTDNWRSAINEFEADDRIVVLENKSTKNLRPALARNLALNYIQEQGLRPNYVWFLDADDMVSPDRWEAHIETIKAQNNCIGTYSSSCRFRSRNKKADYPRLVHSEISYRNPPAKITSEDLACYNPIPLSSSIVRADLALALRFDAGAIHDDWYYWYKLISRTGDNKATFSKCSRSVMYYRVVSGSNTSNKFRSACWTFNTLRKIQKNYLGTIYGLLRWTSYQVLNRPIFR